MHLARVISNITHESTDERRNRLRWSFSMARFTQTAQRCMPTHWGRAHNGLVIGALWAI